ncbi:aromatase/cyclase [Actinokineospora enzanensis]|uniref:aromatase/cyclase n=1 Tax=Actinokineospora enzanensis TaxID=155975 RepID=UPI000370C031|nr:aromatase/cyclase [Actinokineospora enzanensis]
MSESTRTHLTHEIDIAAPPAAVYALIGDAAAWPRLFEPTIHVEQTALTDTTERLAIWATANGEVKSWTSHRVLDQAGRVITFQQEVSSPPVASMKGTWRVLDGANGGTKLVLEHDFTAVDDKPESLAWITEATNRNSETELANLKAVAERAEEVRELEFEFEDSVTVLASPETVYDFLYDASRWSERLPHVPDITLTEDEPNVQRMSMDTLARDGSVHTTESVRVCFPAERITYKQLRTPSLMTAHVGEWRIRKEGDAVTVTSWHAVVVNSANIGKVLGAEGTVESAKAFIRAAAGGNSQATLALAKKYAEGHDA